MALRCLGNSGRFTDLCRIRWVITSNAVTAGSIARIERELAALQMQTTAVEDSYGPDVLHLTIIKGHLGKWLGNAAILRWLAKHRPEYLKEFQRITETENIASA